MDYKEKLVSIGILDFNRPKEAEILLRSLRQMATFDHKTVYVSNGGEQDYVKKFYDEGLIDTLILNKKNEGCGIGTRQVFESCMTEWVIYVQVDQYLAHPITENLMQMFLALLGHENDIRKNMKPYNEKLFYLDLANNQGHGNYSERSHLIKRKRYLSIPNLDKTIGGPGPYANHQWTENLVQQYMKENGLYFYSLGYFGDNGRNSFRENPDGSQWLHYPDTKQLWLIKGPVKEKYIYPKFSDKEWENVISTQQWESGKIPENEVKDSFHVWN